jgi:hypothetical protein
MSTASGARPARGAAGSPGASTLELLINAEIPKLEYPDFIASERPAHFRDDRGGRREGGLTIATPLPSAPAPDKQVNRVVASANPDVPAQALRLGGAQRVAVLDVDYHHGNGTQAIFFSRADVLFVSLHGDPLTEYPFYLGHANETGAGEGAGFNLNLPLPAGTGAAAWLDALEVACQCVAAHRADAIGGFGLQHGEFARLGARLRRLGLPTAFVLEGGYASAELGHNACHVLEGFEAA